MWKVEKQLPVLYKSVLPLARNLLLCGNLRTDVVVSKKMISTDDREHDSVLPEQ